VDPIGYWLNQREYFSDLCVMGGSYRPFGHMHLLTNMLILAWIPRAAFDGFASLAGQSWVEPGSDERARRSPSINPSTR
jgi:hypothetical protein